MSPWAEYDTGKAKCEDKMVKEAGGKKSGQLLTYLGSTKTSVYCNSLRI